MAEQNIPTDQSMPTPSTPATPATPTTPEAPAAPQQPVVQPVQQMIESAGYQPKFAAVKEYFAKPEVEPVAQVEPGAPSEVGKVTRESNPELFLDEAGKPYGNKSENAKLAYDYYDELKSFTGYLIDKNPEVFDGDENVSGDNWDPEYVLERVGYSDEEIAARRKSFYHRNGYAVPDETKFYTDEPANPEVAKEHEQFLIEQEQEARQIYSPILFSNYTEEELAEYIRDTGGYEIGTARRLASQANSKFHADMLIANEQARFNQIYGGQKYVAPQGTVADDMGAYTVGFWDVFANSARQTLESTPGALASVGASAAILAGKLTGEDVSKYENYISDVALHAAVNQTSSQMLRDAVMRTYKFGFDDHESFLTSVALRGTELGGMLAIDMGTSVLTGKIPGVTTLLSAAGRSPKNIVGAIARMGGTEGTARTAIGQSARIIELPGVVRSIGESTAGRFRTIAAREITHGPNTFLMRVYGETFAAKYDRQMDRAAAAGRETNLGDVLLAQTDAAMVTTISHLIGKNIPKFGGRIPSSGPGSNGLASLLGSRGFTPATLRAATERAADRLLLGFGRGGADMLAFELLLDAYALTDQEDRAEVLDRYINNTEEQVKHLFGSFLIGLPLGASRGLGGAASSFREFRQYKDGFEAYRAFNSLSSSEKRKVLDQLSDAHLAGMMDRVEAEKRFVNQDNTPLRDFTREELAEIVFLGDRSVPDAVLRTMEGLNGHLEARHVRAGDLARGSDRQTLVNENGQVEVTRLMALTELQRRGEATDVVQFMNGKIDTLFAGRGEIQSRRQAMSEELARRIQPSSPTSGQVTAVRGFADNLDVMLRDPRRMTAVEFMAELNNSERQRVVKTAALMAIAGGYDNLTPEQIKRAKVLAQGGRRIGPSRFNDPVIRPYLQAAIRQWGYQTTVRRNRQADIERSSTIVDNIIRSNPRLTRWVNAEVQAGRNTPQNPAISRRQMERLAGGRITPQQNSRQARYELARTIEAHARDRMSRFNEGQTVQATPARPQGEMMQRFESKPTIPLEEARSINSVATASSGPAVMSEQRFNELRAEAAAKGARPLELGKPRAVAEAEAAAATGKVERREAPIDAVLERLRAPSADRDVFPVREPAQVRDSDGNPMFGVPIANRLTLAVETLRDAFGATSVELDFAESPAGSLGESLFALGRSHGYSIIVSTGTRERLPEIIDFGNGVISVSSSVPIASARAVIARSGATLRWVSEQPQDFSPIGLLYSLANRGIGLRTLQSAWEAKTGQKYDTELFLEALAATANDRGLSAAVFESFMPLLDKRQRAMIMAAKPKEFADLYAKQLAALEAAGFESPRANASLLGPKKETELVLGVASGAIPYETSKGTVRASLLNAMNEGYERINTYFSTATEIAANIRVNREALIKAINELTGNEEPREGAKIKEMTPEEHHADMDRRIAEVSDAIEPIVLYERGKADIDKAKFIERMYPGIIQSALRNLKKKLTPKQSDPVTFEHLGKIVTVIPAKQKNGKNTIGSLIIEERDLVTATGRNAELKLTESERETVDMAREMLARGEERTEVPISELGGDKPPAPPKPPKEPTPEGGDMPEAGETRLSVSESEQRKTGLKGLFLRTVGKWMMDPNSLANLLGDKNLEKVIRDSYEIDQRIENQKQEQLDTVRRIVRELERDKSSTLINGKDGTELIKVLETEIEPTRAALDNHPMTAKLTEREKDFVIALKQIFEEHRQDHIAFLRDTVRVGYKAQSNMRAMADRANKFDKDLDVEVLRERGSGRKYFMVNDGRERVRMDREGFIDFMVNRQVPENYGYRFSYFPHMFFGSYRAKMSVVKDGKVVREIPFGVGEAGKREVERAEVMRQVEEKIEELRLIDPEYGFDIKMSAGGATAPSEAVYMPMALRRRLVRAIRNETGGITSEINDALMGKLTSKPVKTAFLASMLKREGAENYSTDVLRVAELAIAAHYRNKLSREIDKATRKTIEEMEGGGSERWVTDYAIGTLHHGVYGNKNGIIADTLGNSYSGFGAKTMGALRTVQFYRQLARPAQHVINSTQATQVWALIGTKGFAQAVKFYNSPEGQKFLKDYGFFDTNGRFDPGKFGDALGPRSMNAMNGIHRVLNKFTGKFWDANSEARNQNFAFAALAHHAMTKMNMSPQEAATYGRLWGSLFTQYRFSRFNDPLLLRGDFARTAGQFKRFFIQSMGLLGTLARHAKNGDVVEGLPRFSPFARFMLLNTLLGGFRGSLIGATGILAGSLGSGIYSAIRQTTDDEYLPGLPEKPFASQEEAFAWLKKNVGEGAAEYIMFGAFNAAGIDASGNFNLMNFGFGGPLEWLAGPSLGMFKRTYSDVFDQTDAMGRPVHTRAFESLIDSGQTTKSFRSLVELIYFLNSFDESTPERVDTFLGILSPNKYRSGGGELVRFRSLRETVLNAAGFRTTDESAEVLQNNLTVLWQDQFSQVKRRVAGVYTTDPQRALRMMADWNRRYGAFLPMNFMDISSQVENQIQRQTTSRGLRTLNRRVNDAVQNALGQQQ